MKIDFRKIGIFLVAIGIFQTVQGQDSIREPIDKLVIDGVIVKVDYDKDTLLIADLEDVYVSSPRNFDSVDEYLRYMKYRRYATKVYPYAIEAIKIFREVEVATLTMKPRKRKKHIKKLHKRYKQEFAKPLKNLSKTQGKILIKMIEKELDKPFYVLIKGLRGGWTAAYWNTMSRPFGYRLKEGYVPGDDKILDAVLNDLDISHKIEQGH